MRISGVIEGVVGNMAVVVSCLLLELVLLQHTTNSRHNTGHAYYEHNGNTAGGWAVLYRPARHNAKKTTRRVQLTAPKNTAGFYTK